MKTELNDRTLWYDGTSQIKAELVPSYLLRGYQPKDLLVDRLTDDIRLFNQLADEEIKVSKESIDALDFSWNVPEEFMNIDLAEFCDEKLKSAVFKSKLTFYETRLESELAEIEKRHLTSFFKSLIYVVDTLKKNNVVWGIGRGSSCASLVLFLIGLHQVDPIKYQIPAQEFFH